MSAEFVYEPDCVPQCTVYPARSVSDVPSVFSVGATHVSVAWPVPIASTEIENAASEALAAPSETLITMLP